MLNDTTPNIKLTVEQLQQISTVETRLANLNTQISVATNNLKIIKNDSERIEKERSDTAIVLSDLTVKKETLSKDVADLQEVYTKTQNSLSELNDEILSKTSIQNAKETELSDRESIVTQREQKLITDEQKLVESQKTLSEQVISHNEKVSKLEALIATI